MKFITLILAVVFFTAQSAWADHAIIRPDAGGAILMAAAATGCKVQKDSVLSEDYERHYYKVDIFMFNPPSGCDIQDQRYGGVLAFTYDKETVASEIYTPGDEKQAGADMRAFMAAHYPRYPEANKSTWPVFTEKDWVQTNFGKLTKTSDDDGALQLNGTNLSPEIKGNVALMGMMDLNHKGTAVAVKTTDANGCAMFQWVVLTASGYRISPSFGTCSDRLSPALNGHQIVTKVQTTGEASKSFPYDVSFVFTQ